MPFEKHEIQITCSHEKAWIDDCIILKCKTMCEKAYETQKWLKDLGSGQRIFQSKCLSFFIS